MLGLRSGRLRDPLTRRKVDPTARSGADPPRNGRRWPPPLHPGNFRIEALLRAIARAKQTWTRAERWRVEIARLPRSPGISRRALTLPVGRRRKFLRGPYPLRGEMGRPHDFWEPRPSWRECHRSDEHSDWDCRQALMVPASNAVGRLSAVRMSWTSSFTPREPAALSSSF